MKELRTFFCPAKINLFLAVTGRREDGFHELVSLVAPLEYGDELEVQVEASGTHVLSCDDPAVPLGDENLILKAAKAFSARTGWSEGARFHLRKRVPMGAGLGGGSSNAALALRALNEAAGEPLEPEALKALAAEIGSDCPLFLKDGPVVMRGRGERVESVDAATCARLQEKRLLIFKPAFGINTAWAYQTLAAGAPKGYLPEAEAEAWLGTWIRTPAAPVEDLGFNSLEVPAFGKFIALPALLQDLHTRHGVRGHMSGSGSACYAFLDETVDVSAMVASIRDAWGETAFCELTRVRGRLT